MPDDINSLESIAEKWETDCNKILNQLLENKQASELVSLEQELWQKLAKAHKSNPNGFMINYFIGFYVTFQETLFYATSSKEKTFKFNRFGMSLHESSRELLYNIHIHLGDLYRYADSRANAKYYYQKALGIDSRRATAYNQLALCTPLTKAYKCIYFSVRASKATQSPISDTNIRQAISRIDSPIFEQFRKGLGVKLSANSFQVAPPDNGPDWFYLTVISIYFNDFNQTFNLLLDFILNQNVEFSHHNDFDYSLMALDVALDWILLDYHNINKIGNVDRLKSFSSHLHKSTWSESDGQNKPVQANIGLKHNLMLKDFLPLKEVYDNLNYYHETEKYNVEKHRKILISRLIFKLQHF